MKKIFALVVSILLCSFSFTYAAGMFGAPEGAYGPYMGLGYWYDQTGMTPDNGSDFTIKQNQGFVQGGYGWSGSEIYARFGFSDLRAQENDVDSKFVDAYRTYATLGGKYFGRINEAFAVGPFIQGTYYFSEFSQNDVSIKDWWDVALGLGFQYKAASNVKLYAGPYIYWSDGKIESGKTSTNFDPQADGGVYFGVTYDVNKKLNVTAEGKYNSNDFSGGLMVNHPF